MQGKNIHKFDFKDRHKLDSVERRKNLPPHKTLLDLGLKGNDIMADLGSGIGYFTIPASQIVGPGGKIFAMDISLESLDVIKNKIKKIPLSNIEIVKVDEGSLKIEDNSVNFVFACNVLHEVEDLDISISEIKRILIDGGKIAIIEWKKIDSVSGPPKNHRLDENFLRAHLLTQGFKDVRHVSLNGMQYTVEGYK